MTKIKFLGASKTVTGSCYLFTHNDKNYLIDCGMFQGPDVFNLNYEEFKFDPKTIDVLFLTHAHIDHCGLIPKLVKEGFRGQIYCTLPTAKLLDLILTDSAKVQDNNNKFRNIAPLYSSDDVLQTLDLVKSVDFDEKLNVNDLTVKYRLASHILGAATIEISTSDGKNISFSGDLGHFKTTMLKGYGDYEANSNIIIMEALYGNKVHPQVEEALDNVAQIINTTTSRNGNVIIPIFAIQRSQEMLFYINKLQKTGKIDGNVQIFFDAPLGKRVLEFYTGQKYHFNERFLHERDPFGFQNNNIKFVMSNKNSLRIRKQRGCVILAGGGMLEGGRVLNHLNNLIEDRQSTLLITGFQAEGTLGRALLERPKKVLLQGRSVDVKIDIQEVYGFSAHADQPDLLRWLNRYNKNALKNIFLVHSEIEQSTSFMEIIEQEGYTNISIPGMGEEFIF